MHVYNKQTDVFGLTADPAAADADAGSAAARSTGKKRDGGYKQ